MNGWTNDAGEPIMSGDAWRAEQALDAAEPPYDPDDYLTYDDEYDDDDEDDGPPREIKTAKDLLNADDEVVVVLDDGHTLRSGTYDKSAGNVVSGEYVRLCAPDGTEIAYWDQAEWAADPALVMGAIINSAAGLRLTRPDRRLG